MTKEEVLDQCFKYDNTIIGDVVVPLQEICDAMEMYADQQTATTQEFLRRQIDDCNYKHNRIRRLLSALTEIHLEQDNSAAMLALLEDARIHEKHITK